MNFQQLNVFLTLAQTRNFSETGRLLNLSQPTVTQTLKGLEAQLSTRLMKRSTHAVELTEAGELFLPYAQQMVQLWEEAQIRISKLEKRLRGTLKMGSSMTTSEVILPSLMGHYHRRYPQVQIKVTVNNSERLLAELEEGKLDLAIIEAPLTSKKLCIQPFTKDELVCILSATHPVPPGMEHADSLTLEQLAELPLIMRERGSGTRLALEEALHQAGISVQRLLIQLELNSSDAIKELVQQGLGAAVISKQLIQKELELGLLRQLPIIPVPIERYFYYAYRPQKMMKPPVEALLKVIQDMYADDRDQPE